MRVSRFAVIVPALLVWSGCTADAPSDDKSGDSIFVAEDEQAKDLASELAVQHIAERPHFLHEVGDVKVARVVIDNDGEAHTRVQQTIQGVPVFEGEAIVHIGRDGMLNSVTDKFVRNVKVDVKPSLRPHEAEDLAIAEIGGGDYLLGVPKTDLQILRRDGIDRLTYRVQLDSRTAEDDPSMPVIFVDAHTGDIAWSYDNLETVKNRKTYNGKNLSTLPGTLVRSEGQAPIADATANQAHDNAGHTHDYYLSKHGRDSFDGQGATITSTVHHKINYVNAFWNGTQMVYGDGDGVQSGPLTVLDVVGHEITHAVTERSSNLTYANESGALNEAMSDIFGASIEVFRDGAVSGNTWKIGEECWTPGTAGDALRYMDDPAQAGDYDYYPTRYVGTSDNGGVHWNSGIANLAFALMVKGGTHPRGKTSNVVPAIDANPVAGVDKAAAIFYKANTTCLTAGSTFADANACTQQAASALFGASAVTSVAEAWKAVGVPAPLTWSVIDTKSNLSAGKNTKLSYTVVTPAGAKALKFTTAGNNGDADLYVRFGSAPTLQSYDCRSAGANSNESCTMNPAKSGTYYVMINAYSAYSGLTYTASSGQ
jgi:vibriolysin